MYVSARFFLPFVWKGCDTLEFGPYQTSRIKSKSLDVHFELQMYIDFASFIKEIYWNAQLDF